jgi:hypothetical protein
MLRRMSGDPERDDSNPRPTAPAGVLGGAGKRPESASVETNKRVPKSAFAQTIAGLNVPGATPPPPSEPEKLDVPRGTSDAAEPLREPSERPAPTPYKRAQGAWVGTMQMPELATPAGNRSEERMIVAKPVAVHGAAKVGTPAQAGMRGEPTVRMPTTADGMPPSNRSVPAAPPPSGAPPAMPSSQSPAAKSPIPPAPTPSARATAAKRDDHSVPRLSLGVEKIPSGPPASKLDVSGMSQPLQLSLDARDHVESSLRPEASIPQRSMLPWIVLAVFVIGGGVAFALTRGGDEPAPVAADRVEAVPAVAPAAPTEVPQAVAPSAPAVPTAPVVPSAPPAEATPTPAPPVEEAKAQPEQEKVEAKPSTKRKARRTKKAAAKTDRPVLKVTPQGEGDLEAALRAAERMAEPEEELAPPEPPSAEPPAPDEE